MNVRLNLFFVYFRYRLVVKIEILNMLGQVISQSAVYLHAANAQMNQVDIASLQDGIYMIRIEHEGKKISKSFIKK